MNSVFPVILNSLWGTLKSSVWMMLVIGLLLTNVFSLINDKFHDGLYEALAGMVPTSWVKNSKYSLNNKLGDRHKNLKAKHAKLGNNHKDLKTKHAKLDGKYKKLSGDHIVLSGNHKKLSSKLDAHTANSEKIAKRIAKRTIKNTTVNISSIPIESIPWLGAGMVAAVTIMDIKDACDNMKDMDSMIKELGLDSHNETGKICGLSTEAAKNKYANVKVVIGETIGGTKNRIKGKWSGFKEATGEILGHEGKKYRTKLGDVKEATGDILWHIFNK